MKTKSSNNKHLIPGFLFSGITAGIKESGAKDLALIVSEHLANMAALFTTNKIKAAPVKLDMRRIKSGRGQAIIINSGNANACTGEDGYKDAVETANVVSRELGLAGNHVYVSSTGIIGRPLPLSKIMKAIPMAVKELSPASLINAAAAIMTTDTFPKIAFKKVKIGGKTGTIGGIAKGAAMICPDMATMLCFIMTDISVNSLALDAALRRAVGNSFNMLTVDNDMSTNDTVIVMANGKLGNKEISNKSAFYEKFEDCLSEVAYELARMIATDGEGSTKLIEVIVKGAKSISDAKSAARAVASSMLVKTAIYGQDPNWGRIIAAIGYSKADVREERIDIYLNNIKIVEKGRGLNNDLLVKKSLSGDVITISVNLRLGKSSSKAITCDLTEKYIKLNAHYTT
jgi:glutamate N-acetyltransferase/amino-acid N-acetyltransferase